MSVIYFDGTNIFYDSIAVSPEGDAAEFTKVVFVGDFIVCGVGSAVAIADVSTALIQYLRDGGRMDMPLIAINDNYIVHEDTYNMSTLIVINPKQKKRWDVVYSTDKLYMMEMGYGKFCIGHPRAKGSVLAVRDVMQCDYKKLITVLQSLEDSPLIADKVVMAPYYLYDTTTKQLGRYLAGEVTFPAVYYHSTEPEVEQ